MNIISEEEFYKLVKESQKRMDQIQTRYFKEINEEIELQKLLKAEFTLSAWVIFLMTCGNKL